jgi:hypothetical protein
LTLNGTLSVEQIQEHVVVANGATGFFTNDWNNGAILYISSLQSNFTINVTNVPTTANKSYVVTAIIQQSTNAAYYCSTLSVNSLGVTVRWPNATQPTPATSRTEVESFTLYYSGAVWTALAQYTSFG